MDDFLREIQTSLFREWINNQKRDYYHLHQSETDPDAIIIENEYCYSYVTFNPQCIIDTAQSKCYDLCSCFFDTCFYKIQGKFSGTKNKTGSKLMASQDQFVFICVCCCHFLCPPFFLSSIYLLSQQLPPPINCRISTTSPSFSTVVS